MHGVNVVFKQEPFIPDLENFHPQNSLTERDIKDLKKWGINFVRLGVSWEAVEVETKESTPNNLITMYNYTYLDEIDKIIKSLGRHGIYTMVDMHQDVFARMICGQGMPNFYARQIARNAKCEVSLLKGPLVSNFKKYGVCKNFDKDYKFRRDSDDNPLLEDCLKFPFATYYASAESLELFDALYTNKHGL